MRYPVISTGYGEGNQSWDILAGETIGPHPVDYPIWAQIWRWPNFTPRELACEGTGLLMIHLPSLDALQAVRVEAGRSLVVNSAYRAPLHNLLIGGSRRSRHMSGGAYDIRAQRAHQPKLIRLARKHGFNGFGQYRTFLHMDLRAAPAVWRKN